MVNNWLLEYYSSLIVWHRSSGVGDRNIERESWQSRKVPENSPTLCILNWNEQRQSEGA
jgi:hypothetical protein